MIEAAENLPRWADPETCVNRVYLHGGQVHVISVGDRPSSLTPLPMGTPSPMDAVHIVRSMPHLTRAPDSIQQPIQQRIDKCTSEIDSSLHRCSVHVPAGVAALLNSYPALIAPAVHALCQRDASAQLPVTRAMRYFPPETRVWTSVTFTKCLYAMAVQHNFQPDRRTGWTLPAIGHPKRSASELGLKVAVGFELLANIESVLQKNEQPQAIDADPRWNRFLTTLTDKGFFQNFLEGSKDYCALMEKAREFFLSSVDQDVGVKEPVVLRLLESLNIDTDKLKRAEAHLPPDDDDSWLNVDAAALEHILEDKFGGMNLMEDASQLAPQLDAFLNKSSDFQGLTPSSSSSSSSSKERKSSRKLSQLLNPPSRRVSTLSNGSDVSQISSKIGFDADSFNATMQGILDFVLPEDDWDLESSASGSSDYGGEGGERIFDEDVAFSDNYAAAMDQELLSTNVPHTSVDATRKESVLSQASETYMESFRPVKIDSAALESLLTSYTLQHGHPGPASTLLNHLKRSRRLSATKEDEDSN